MQKNNLVLAAVTGLLLAAGWPIYGIPLLLFVAFVPLIIAEKKIRLSNKRRKGVKVLLAAYLSFLLWNFITTWWLWYSTAFGMFFAILVNSLLMALVFLIYHHVARRLPEKIYLLFLPLIWIAFEKFHLNWAFSWPWLNLGNAFSEYTSWIQWYEYTGTFGGSLWIWVVNIGLFKVYENYHSTKNKKALSTGIAKNILIITIPIISSYIILTNYEEPKEHVDIVLLQPNVDPYLEKFKKGNTNTKTATELIKLAQESIKPETDFIIAPETALAEDSPIDKFNFSQEKLILQSILREYPNTNVLTGIASYRFYRQEERPNKFANKTPKGNWIDFYNAALLINRTDSTQFYIKSKLVVGVETFPFRSVLEPLLGDIMLDLGGTVSARSTQKERAVFTSSDKKYKAAPVICYESIYGEFVTGYIKKDADFLAIITNDAWWDESQGHKQHLSYARLRAIETRRSIARSANTGISALINQKGDILKSLAYGKKGSIEGTISVNTKKTFYVIYGDYIARIAILISILIVLYAFAIKRTTKKSSLPPVK
ncbi:apolipoprotein N-acyltransferase [Flavobacteriaceae bacterium R38]|nr:apolipoprotein N-acyltransferase [Flavobacteriaceae bacterium R38]